MNKIYDSKNLWGFFLIFSLTVAEAMAFGGRVAELKSTESVPEIQSLTIAPAALAEPDGSLLVLENNLSSVIVNESASSEKSAGISGFSLMKFKLSDVGGDTKPTSLTQLVFTGKENGIGIKDADGYRLKDVLENIKFKLYKGEEDGTDVAPVSVTFSDYNTLVLTFTEGTIQVPEEETYSFELVAALKATAFISDHATFSLEAQVEDFQTGASSSGLSPANNNFEGTVIEFDISATALAITEEPALVVADMAGTAAIEGEAFSVRILAVDINGRTDTDHVNNATISLIGEGEEGRELMGETNLEIINGEAIAAGLIYKTNTLPEDFFLQVQAQDLISAGSKPIHAVAQHDKNSQVSAVTGSGTNNINYLSFREAENLDVINSVELGTFEFKDSPGKDGLATIVTGLEIHLSNPQYLLAIGLFHGTEKLAEQVVLLQENGIIKFDNLDLNIADNSIENLQVRASFRDKVKDNEKIAVRIHKIHAAASGSQFGYPDSGIPESEMIVVGNNPADDKNRIEVIGKSLNVLSLPAKAETGTSFSLIVEAVDEAGNRDLDVSSVLEFKKATGPSALSPESLLLQMAAGYLEAGGMEADQPGLYSLLIVDKSTAISSKTTDKFQVYAPYTYNGVFISEISNGPGNRPNFLELYNASAEHEYGLENLELRVYENGSTTPSHRIHFSEGAGLGPQETYVISNIPFSEEWGEPFSYKEQQVNTGLTGNGNDVYELYDVFRERTVDVFGIKGEDGNGKDWNYREKLVNRRRGITEGNGGNFGVESFTIVPYSHSIASPGTPAEKDEILPSLLTVAPENGSEAVLENSAFTLTFSEVINLENKTVSFKRKDTDETVYSAMLTNTAVVSGEGSSILLIQPAQPLPGATELYITFEEGGVTDLAGNKLPAVDYSFKTTDSTDPFLVSLEPADNRNDAVLEPLFRMTFSENVLKGSGMISVYELSGELVFTFPVTSGLVWQSTPDVLEFELPDRLSKLTEYYVMASPGIVRDAAGNLFAGITTEDGWNFKTTDPYINSPKIVNLSPLNGEKHVARDHKPRISFHEEVFSGRGTIDLYENSTATLKARLDVEAGNGITISGREVQLDFGDLDYNTAYTVRISAGAFKDIDGNPVEGTSGNMVWIFTTVADGNPLIVLESNTDPLYFGNIPANNLSPEKIYKIGGRNLLENVELKIPSGFIVSADGGNTYKKESLSLTIEGLKGFAEILVKFAPEVADGNLYQTHLEHISEGVPVQKLAVLGREGAAPAIQSIAEVRALGTGAEVKIRGIVTDGDAFRNDRRFVQDATGGVAVYKTGHAVLASLQKGTRVLISGRLMKSTEGLLQISGENLHIEVVETDQILPEAQVVYAGMLNSHVESRLVELKNLKFTKEGERFRLNQTYEFTDTRGQAGALKIEGSDNSLIGIEIPVTASIRAIVARSYEQYVLLPRGRADLRLMDPQIITGLPDGKLNFGFVEAGNKSGALRLRVQARDLAEGIKIRVAKPFEVSRSSVMGFSGELTLPATTEAVDVWIRFAPDVQNGNIYQSMVELSSSSANSVAIPVAGVEGTKPESVTIAQARVMPVGESVQVRGVVTSSNSISYHERYLQDASAGIVAYRQNDSGFSNIPAGAEIIVSGVLQEFNNLLQIGGDLEWEIVNENAGEVQALVVDESGIGEGNEAKLLKLKGILFSGEGNFEAGRNYEFLFGSGKKGWMKIPAGNHPLAGKRIPYKANLTALLSHSGENYYMVPREESDLQPVDAVVTTTFPEGPMEFFFVPANSVSQSKYILVDGYNLEGSVNLSVSPPFQVSVNGTNYGISGSISKENARQVKVYLRFNPTLSGGGVSEDYLVMNTANGRTVKVPLTGIEGLRPEVLPIAQARALGAGEKVKVQGVLTSGSGFLRNRRFIQDGTAGLVIAASSEVLLNPEAGDKVTVEGKLAYHDGLLQLEEIESLTIIQENAGIPAPVAVSAASLIAEGNEAELISLAAVRFASQGFFEAGRRYTVVLENGEEASIRIAGDNPALAGKIIPDSANLVGVLARKGDRYEIWPRQEEDVQPLNYSMAILTEAPANGFNLGITEAGEVSRWEEYSVTGVELNEAITIAVSAPFEISSDRTNWSRALSISEEADREKVYVRFSPQTAEGEVYYGEIIHSAGGIRSVIHLEAEEGTSLPAQGTEFQENFDLCLDLNSFSRYDRSGTAQWECVAGRGVGNTGAVGIFQDLYEAEQNEDWLISPALTGRKGSRVSFDVARRQNGPELELLVSSDYPGSGNPAHAVWEKLPVTMPVPSSDLSAFEKLRGVDLSNYAGQEIYIAFRYTATYGEASAYLIDNFMLQDLPELSFAEQTHSVQEGQAAEIKLVLSHPASGDLNIMVSVREGNGVKYGENADYLTNPPKSGTGLSVTVPAGEREVTIAFSALEDLLEEADEQVILSISEEANSYLTREVSAYTTVTIRSNNAAVMSIPNAREVGEQGKMFHVNRLVKLTGVAYGPDFSQGNTGLEFRLIDHSAESYAGITVKTERAGAIAYSFREGDKLEVTGVLRQLNGLAVLEPQQFTVLQSDVTLKEAASVKVLSEEWESALVKLGNVELVDGWQNNPSGTFNVNVRDEEGNLYAVQIRSGSDLYGAPQPAGKFTVTGFVAQQDTEAPFTEGYYLLPRNKADIKLPTGFAPASGFRDLVLYPNPAAAELHISSAESQRFEQVEVFSIKGNRVLSTPFKRGDILKLESLPSGIYLLKVTLTGGEYKMMKFSIIK